MDDCLQYKPGKKESSLYNHQDTTEFLLTHFKDGQLHEKNSKTELFNASLAMYRKYLTCSFNPKEDCIFRKR